MQHVVVVVYYSVICAMVGYGSTCGPPTPPRGSAIIHPPNQQKYEKGTVVLFGCKQGFYLAGKPIIKCLGSTWTQRQFRCVGFCPELRQISNGQVIETRPNIGQAAVEFRCNGKFRLVGTPRLECIDGRWNGKLPFCEKLMSCPRLRAPPNATLHGSDTTHGARANFACLTGFDLFGSPTLTCSDGVWSSNVPTCKAYCMKIRDLPNGRKFGAGFSHGQVVSFECKLGFELVGDRALRCIHGRWNSSVPVCKVTLCSEPTIPSNSYIIYPQTNHVKYTHGTHVFLACRDGYYLQGSPIMVCNQTVWFKREFSCIASCTVVDSIKNGIITHATLKEGGEVEIACHTNFTLVGSAKLTCIKGKWSDNLPSCKEPCPDPGHPHQGNRIGDDFRHEKPVTFTCPRGYVMEGARTIKCSDGRWSNKTPSCKAPCKELVPPAHGRRMGEDFRHGHSAWFICSYGYARIGASTVRCYDGNWSNPTPVCKGICTQLRPPNKGRLHGNKVRFLDGEEVTFSCENNHDLLGKARLRCVGKKWDSSVPECKASCDTLTALPNGKVNGSHLKHGSLAHFSCNTGFQLKGPKQITCIDGKWSSISPTCKVVQCDDPGKPVNGAQLVNKGFVYGGFVTFTCNKDYTLRGTSTIYCQENKKWTGSVPRCLAPCPDPGRPYQGNRIGNDFRHDKTVTFTCPKDYIMEGLPTITCSDGRWRYRKPSCKAPCKDPAPPAHGRRSGEDFRHGRSVRFYCSIGYTTIGASVIMCNDGNWNSPAPVCKVVDCGPLDKPEHGDTIEQVGLTFGNRIVFECKDKGYELSGSRIRTCQSDGTWSGSITTCDIVQCGDPGKPSNGAQKINKGFVYGGSVEFICDKDYTLSGTATIYCQDNKRWTASVPQCLAPCPDPGHPHQGNRFGDDFRHGKLVTFTCPKYYYMEGVRTITCSDGRWSNTKPSCKGICLQPRTPYKVRLLGSKARYLDGQEASFFCDINYDLYGNDRIRCVGKKWDSSVPVCKARCSFSRIAKGGVYLEGRSEKSGMIRHGENLTYGCLPTYTMIGSKTRECDNGRWTNDAPVCKAPCLPPNDIAHGKKFGIGYGHDETVWYHCDAEYTLKGSNRLTCKDGTWTPDPPECKAPCSNPGTPVYGSMQVDDLRSRHDSLVTFICNPNYQLNGDKNMRCNDGSWSGSVPNCVAVCPNPVVPSNGKPLEKNQFQEGETVTFQCNREYNLVGNATIRCEGGMWSGEIPKCRAQCSFDGNPDNGYTTEGNFRLHERLPDGSNVKYACRVSYTLVGSDTRHCDEGSWNTSRPSCKASCDDPGLLAEGVKIGNHYSHGQIVTYRCTTKGYSLVGNSTLTCNDGSWDSQKPECQAPCRDPGIPSNGTKDGDDYRSRANVTFRCNPSFELIGSRVLYCRNGEWSDSRPTCSNCARPLGLQEKKNWITSPSSLTGSRYPPNAVRLNGLSAWCPSRTPAYLQIDLDKSYKLTAIATQGGTAGDKWVQRYTISFKAGKEIIYYTESGLRKDIPGNKDASSLVQYKFKKPFITKFVRIHPSSSQNDHICLRVELYGCDPNPDCILVGSMFWGWWKYNHGANNYYKAYVTKLNATHLDFALEIGNNYRRSYRRNDPVLILDTVPEMKNILINSSVIARQHPTKEPNRYRSGIVVGFPSASLVSVKFDDGETLFVLLKYLRLVNRPGFCVKDI